MQVRKQHPSESYSSLRFRGQTAATISSPVAYYYQVRLMETIFRTHCPASDDIIQLLVSLFSTEDRHRVLTEARKWLRAMAPEGTANPQRWAGPATPDEREAQLGL